MHLKNDDNKNLVEIAILQLLLRFLDGACFDCLLLQIVECSALPTLILMLGSEDAAIHYEAVWILLLRREFS